MMIPPRLLTTRGACADPPLPETLRVTPDERFRDGYAERLRQLPVGTIAPVAPVGASNPNRNVSVASLLTQSEMRELRCESLSGSIVFFVEELLYPGDQTRAIAHIPAGPRRLHTERHSTVEAYVYVFDLRRREFLLEVHAAEDNWQQRPMTGGAEQWSATTAGIVTVPCTGQRPDQLGFLLSSVRLGERARSYLRQLVNPSVAFVCPFVGSALRGYVALPDPFRWAVEAHERYYLGSLQALRHYRDESANKRFVLTTLKAWKEDSHTGVQEGFELAEGALERGLRALDNNERTLRRQIQIAAEYLLQCVDQPDFRAAELAAQEGGPLCMSLGLQVWALITGELLSSGPGQRLASLAMADGTDGEPPHLPKVALFGDEVAPGGLDATHGHAGMCAHLILAQLAPLAFGRGDYETIFRIYRRHGFTTSEIDLRTVVADTADQAPTALSGVTFTSLDLWPSRTGGSVPRPVQPSAQNLAGHNMPQGQHSSFLFLNGLFTVPVPEAAAEWTQLIGSFRDAVLWNVQDSLGDKMDVVHIKKLVKTLNFFSAVGKLRSAIDARNDRDVLRRGISLAGSFSSLVKTLSKVVLSDSVLDAIPATEGVGSAIHVGAARGALSAASPRLTTDMVQPLVEQNEALLSPLAREAHAARHAERATAASRAIAGASERALTVPAIGKLTGVISNGCDGILFAFDAAEAARRDDRGAAIGYGLGAATQTVLVIGDALWLTAAASGDWVAAARIASYFGGGWGKVLGLLVTGAYFIASAMTDNVFERFAAWSHIGRRGPSTNRGPFWDPIVPFSMPTRSLAREAEAMMRVGAQFKIARRTIGPGAPGLAEGGIAAVIELGYFDDDAVLHLIVEKQERGQAQVSRIELSVTLSSASSEQGTVGHIRREYADGRLRRVEVLLHRNAYVPDPGQDVVLGPDTPRSCKIRARLELGSPSARMYIPYNPARWVELELSGARAAIATEHEIMSHDGSKWVDQNGHPFAHGQQAPRAA